MIVVSALDRPIPQQAMSGVPGVFYPGDDARVAGYLDGNGPVPAFGFHEVGNLGNPYKSSPSNINISLRESDMLAA
jgi:hypothetical protein